MLAVATSAAANIAPHERAVCGVLAGVLEPALSVAETHEDRVWARLSVLLDRAIERSLTGRAGAPAVATPEDAGGGGGGDDAMAVDGGVQAAHVAAAAVDVTHEQILEAFREAGGAGHGVESVDGEIVRRVRTVRAYLALGPSIPAPLAAEMLAELAALGRSALERGVEWACRFAAHVALFLKKVGLVDGGGGGAGALASFEAAMVSYARLAMDQELADESAARHATAASPVRPIMYDLVARHLSELENVDRLVEAYTEVMAGALRGDLQQEWILAAGSGAAARQVHERRTLSLHRAGMCFARHGRETLNRIAVSSVDRVWARHLRSYASQSGGGSFGGGGGQHGGQGDAGLQPLVADTPTEYDEVSHDDELVVRAIEFLLFPGFGNYEEALRRATAAARRFFLLGKRAAARHVVEWFPADALAEVPAGRCDNEVHELDCWRAYMTAVSRHNEWRSYYFSQRPAPLDGAVRAAALADPGEVVYELQAAANLKLSLYEECMDKYTRVSEAACDAAVEALRIALLFDGGWMRDGDDGGGTATARDENQSRQRARELCAVRKVGIPQLAALLQHVLHESRLHAEATELATLIADDGRRLYEDFDRAELGAFLQRIAHSAVLLADAAITGGGVERPYVGQMFEEFTAVGDDGGVRSL
jgi:hypothetical protein